ncbi:MAG: hypothetical protein ACRCUT_01650 [Spirochaetota bacterium]
MDGFLGGDELAALLAGVVSGAAPSGGECGKKRYIPECSPSHPSGPIWSWNTDVSADELESS